MRWKIRHSLRCSRRWSSRGIGSSKGKFDLPDAAHTCRIPLPFPRAVNSAIRTITLHRFFHTFQSHKPAATAIAATAMRTGSHGNPITTTARRRYHQGIGFSSWFNIAIAHRLLGDIERNMRMLKPLSRAAYCSNCLQSPVQCSNQDVNSLCPLFWRSPSFYVYALQTRLRSKSRMM